MRAAYAWRKRRFAARAGRIEDDGYEEQSAAYQRTLREVLDAQRRAVVEIRNRGEISNDVMHQNRARARPRGLAARGAARLRERRRVPGLLRPPATTSARGSGYGVAASWKSEMACVTSGTRAWTASVSPVSAAATKRLSTTATRGPVSLSAARCPSSVALSSR